MLSTTLIHIDSDINSSISSQNVKQAIVYYIFLRLESKGKNITSCIP